MARWEDPVGPCQLCGTKASLVLFKKLLMCPKCLNPEPPKQRATDFLIRTDESSLTKNFGEKFEVGDIMEVQLGVKLKAREWNKKHAKKLAADKRKDRARVKRQQLGTVV